MKPETARWFARAEEDLGHARFLEQASRSGPAALFAQQAAEKAPKAALTPAYTASRYPDAGGEIGPEDAAELLAAAEEVVAWARTLIS